MEEKVWLIEARKVFRNFEEAKKSAEELKEKGLDVKISELLFDIEND